MASPRLNLDGQPIQALKICMIGAGGFIGSHLCDKLMWETDHSVLAIDVYGDKIQHLLQPGQAWSDRIEFHKLNIKSDSRLEGLIKVSDLVHYCTPLHSTHDPSIETCYKNWHFFFFFCLITIVNAKVMMMMMILPPQEVEECRR